jgi:hypothetical protein
MKKTVTLSFMLVMLIMIGNYAFSQVTPADRKYQSLKEQGKVPIPEQVIPVEPIRTMLPSETGNRDLSLKVPWDITFTQVSFLPDYTGGGGFYSDDGSSAVISLDFTFCFYGTDETFFYINNNGNVSFDGPYSSFTSTGFPVFGYPMLAPFWADIDTRGGLGDVWYKKTANRVVVIWNNTGYYNIHGDKRNTFELIFTDGTDPLIGVGNNVAFSFTTMQWTTGDASGGSLGFGGTPATVGVNKGDGVKYALVGRFDKPGFSFDGPAGANDGVGYLEGKYYEFDACVEDVVIPGEVPVSNWALFIGIALILTFAVIRFRKML